MIDLRNAINRNEIPKNEQPDPLVNIVEKILEFNKQQNISGLKILTSKQMLEKLPIALLQVKVGDTSENLLKSKICQIIYSLYQAKEITKKLYSNIMNSINL